mmetsp:Transcript_149226/g.212117  ORF Transcript_149226/g.212117 Transcript_149226/m.212117 type:complete len:93 (+) Transcript_149226:47-325(+)
MEGVLESLMNPEAALEPTTPTFKPETVMKLFGQNWNAKTKGNGDGMKLAAEYLRCFTIEAAYRAAQQAQNDGSGQVDPEHIEKILPQLLLDF